MRTRRMRSAVGVVVLTVALAAGASTAAAEPAWWAIGGGSSGCTGPEGPYTEAASIVLYVHGNYPSEVFDDKDAPPPYWAVPDIRRYIDRIDVENRCTDPVELSYQLRNGREVRGLLLPGVNRTLYAAELADLGIRFKLSELAGFGGMGFPADPPPYDFVIGP